MIENQLFWPFYFLFITGCLLNFLIKMKLKKHTFLDYTLLLISVIPVINVLFCLTATTMFLLKFFGDILPHKILKIPKKYDYFDTYY